jgi:tight adherence protein C
MNVGLTRGCRILLVVLASAAWGVPPARAADEPIEVVEVRADSFPRIVVRLNASLGDSSVGELAPEHLRVLEDGKLQSTVDLFRIRTPDTPAAVVLAIDVSGSMAEQDRLPQAREAAKGFLGQMRPRDQAALVSFGSEVLLRQGFTSDRRQMIQAIDGLAARGNTRLYDALVRSVNQTMNVRGGSRSVILLSDGEDTESAAEVVDGIALAGRSGVPVYTIGLGREIKADVLERIARETGGRFYHAPGAEDLARVFRLISRQITSQYEIFWVSRLRDEPEREVPVEIKLQAPSLPAGQASFTYRMPRFARAGSLGAAGVAGPLSNLPDVPPPSEEQILLAGLLAGLCVALLYAGVVLPRVRRHLETRLATYVGGRRATLSPVVSTPVLNIRYAELSPLAALAARLGSRLLPQRLVLRLRKMLIQAGFPTQRHLALFLAFQVALTTLLACGGYLLLRSRLGDPRMPLMGTAAVVTLAALGFYLPFVWLRRRVAARKKALLRALPDALDLMAIGVSAGLSLDGAMLEVIQKWDDELSREFSQVLTEIRMGMSRRQALLNLVERTQLEDIRLLVAALVQAEELGTNVSETLTVQAEQLRIRRRQLAEEQARKAPLKMLFPLIFCIFPSLFVVILGPAALSIVRMFRNLTNSL